MTRPTKHPKTGVYQFRKVVPKGLRAIAGKSEIKISLRTKDPEEARRKCAEAALRVEAELTGLRRQEQVRSRPAVPELDSTTIKRVGEVYYAYLLEEDDQRRLAGFGTTSRQSKILPNDIDAANEMIQEDGFGAPTFEERAESWAEWDASNRHLYARGLPDSFFADEVDEVLSWQEFETRLEPDSPSRAPLIRELQAATIRAAKTIRARNEGEPIETPSTEHIRPIPTTAPGQASRAAINGHSLPALLEGWWKESQAVGLSRRTYDSYSTTVNKLVAFLGHEDSERITPDDIVRYKGGVPPVSPDT